MSAAYATTNKVVPYVMNSFRPVAMRGALAQGYRLIIGLAIIVAVNPNPPSDYLHAHRSGVRR